MIAWLGVALLAASWLDGLGYYHLPALAPWAWLVALGTALLSAQPRRPIALPWAWTAALLVAPAIFIAQFPYAAAPLLLCVGLLVAPLGGARAALGAPLGAPLAAGLVLATQSLVLEAYAALTARSHELPPALVGLVSAVLGLLGVDRAVVGNTLVLRSMRQTHDLAACWELLADPVTVCFWAGGLALVAWQVVVARPSGRRWPLVAASWLRLSATVALWLPLRAGVLVALYLSDVLRLEHESKLTSVQLLWSTGVHLALVAPAVVLAWRFVPWPSEKMGLAPSEQSRLPADTRGRKVPVPIFSQSGVPGAAAEPILAAPRTHFARPLVAGALAALAAALATMGLYWEPAGVRADGRVLVEEVPANPDQVRQGGRPAVWEPTDRPFDADWYGHKAGYNYWCIYDYLGKFYSTGRLTNLISPAALADCDVLILKVPVRAYTAAEIDAVVEFVERGGGLLLVGEHTNVYGTSEHLNAVARQFGFQFRYDCLFGVDRVYEDHFVQPLVPHPIVQHVAEMDFATSCSIEPTDWRGRTVIRGLGLKNLGPEYHHENFYPVAEDRPDMRYGAWVQLYATRRGAGRVVGFSDSTIFSNFCTFEPGKAELMLGMVEWLNRRPERGGWSSLDPRRVLWPLAALALIAACFAAQGSGDLLLPIAAAAVLGWALGVVGVRQLHRSSQPPPVVLEDDAPLVRVGFDTRWSKALYPRSGFTDGNRDGFGIFERWFLRLGAFTRRYDDEQIFDSNLIVLAYPNRTPSAAYVERLEKYVADGGHVLVLDSLDNPGSTTGELLAPFGISVEPVPLDGLAYRYADQLVRRFGPPGRDPWAARRGKLSLPAGWPAIEVEGAIGVVGGEAWATLGERTVGATLRHGQGSVTVLGFGTRFSDAQMGVTGDTVPSESLRDVYEVQFELARRLLSGQSLFAPPAPRQRPPASPDDESDSPPLGEP